MNRPRNEAEERYFARDWDAAAEAARQDHHSLVAEIAEATGNVPGVRARAVADRPALDAFAAAWDFEAVLSRLAHEGAGA